MRVIIIFSKCRNQSRCYQKKTKDDYNEKAGGLGAESLPRMEARPRRAVKVGGCQQEKVKETRRQTVKCRGAPKLLSSAAHAKQAGGVLEREQPFSAFRGPRLKSRRRTISSRHEHRHVALHRWKGKHAHSGGRAWGGRTRLSADGTKLPANTDPDKATAQLSDTWRHLTTPDQLTDTWWRGSYLLIARQSQWLTH